MPPWYSEDEVARAIITAMANEAQRVEDFASAVRLQMYPQFADDSYNILALWESLFGLPVKPAGATLAARRALVQAHLQKRNGGSGADWEAAVTQALNTNSWTYTEGPGDYVVTVRIPYGAITYSTGQAQVLIQEITSAHIQVSFGYNTGWLVGISLVGVDAV
jgi:uncharacterized protein YmfQ (DUF2313 family)